MAVGGDDAQRVGVVGDEVQDGAHEHGNRLGEVEELLGPWMAEHCCRVLEIGMDRRGQLVVPEEQVAVRDGDGLVVDVDHSAVRRRVLRDLVHVAHRGYAGAEIEELPNATLTHEITHDPSEKCSVVAREFAGWCYFGDFVGEAPIGFEVMGAAKEMSYTRAAFGVSVSTSMGVQRIASCMMPSRA